METGGLSDDEPRKHIPLDEAPEYIPKCDYVYKNICQHDLVDLFIFAHDKNLSSLRSLALSLLQDEIAQSKRNTIEITAALAAYKHLPFNSPLIKHVTACVVYSWPKHFEDAEYTKPKVPLALLEQLPKKVLLSVIRKQMAIGFGTGGIKWELDRAMFEGITAPGLYEGSSNVFRPDEHALHEHASEEELEECKAFLGKDDQGVERWERLDQAVTDVGDGSEMLEEKMHSAVL